MQQTAGYVYSSELSSLRSEKQTQRWYLRHVSHRLVRYFCGEMWSKRQYNTRKSGAAKMDNNWKKPSSALIFSAPERHYHCYRTRKGERIVARPLFLAPCLQWIANTLHAGFELSTPVYSEIRRWRTHTARPSHCVLIGIFHTDDVTVRWNSMTQLLNSTSIWPIKTLQPSTSPPKSSRITPTKSPRHIAWQPSARMSQS